MNNRKLLFKGFASPLIIMIVVIGIAVWMSGLMRPVEFRPPVEPGEVTIKGNPKNNKKGDTIQLKELRSVVVTNTPTPTPRSLREIDRITDLDKINERRREAGLPPL